MPLLLAWNGLEQSLIIQMTKLQKEAYNKCLQTWSKIYLE